jgi:hypothetical protein
VPVVADDGADLHADLRLPDGPADVAGAEVVLLDARDRRGLDERDRVLPVLPEELPARVDENRGVIELPVLLLLVEGEEDVGIRVARRGAHRLHGRPVDRLGELQPLGLDLEREVDVRRELGQADDLRALLRRLLHEARALLDVLLRLVVEMHLDQGRLRFHVLLSFL